MKVYRYLTGKDDAAFCHRVTDALNRGWQLYGQPTLTFDQLRGEVICGQVITKDVERQDLRSRNGFVEAVEP
jgi:hypothetical protein